MTNHPPDQRRRHLAQIHIGAKELGMDRQTYEQMLWTLGRVHSAADLDDAGRRRVLDHLKARGFRPTRRRRPRPSGERAPLLAKIDALLGKRPRGYAYGILRHMFQGNAPDQLEWATPAQLRKVVAALAYDQRRKAKQGETS